MSYRYGVNPMPVSVTRKQTPAELALVRVFEMTQECCKSYTGQCKHCEDIGAVVDGYFDE